MLQAKAWLYDARAQDVVLAAAEDSQIMKGIVNLHPSWLHLFLHPFLHAEVGSLPLLSPCCHCHRFCLHYCPLSQVSSLFLSFPLFSIVVVAPINSLASTQQQLREQTRADCIDTRIHTTIACRIRGFRQKAVSLLLRI